MFKQTVEITAEDIRMLDYITPGPYEYDCGNGEVESWHKDHHRTPMCVRVGLFFASLQLIGIIGRIFAGG